jgi:hypothetical protein
MIKLFNKLSGAGSMAASLILFSSGQARAFFLDGTGHYGLIGETRVNPEFQKNVGTYQATRVSFDLNGEVRANDRASFNLRLGLSENPSGLYLGDTAKPKTCETRRSTTAGGPAETSCDGRSQSAVESDQKSLTPIIREAYGKYAFNYCILTAGRRSRQQGLGAFMSAGKNPFDNDASIFDGVTCDVNIQKQQDLGFTFGFDKLQETGTWIDNPYDNPESDATKEGDHAARSNSFGANDPSDDADQIFFGINFDDLKSKGPGAFGKQVGIYFANILSSDLKTDVKFFDLYTGFFMGKFALKNEIIFRTGKTADPAIVAMGGLRSNDGSAATNNINSIGLAGNLEYTVAKSGASLGPEEFNEGNLHRHVVFSDYAFAPGDADGYYINRSSATRATNAQVGESRRNNRAKAMAFHRNYHPALLFFNGRATSKRLAVPGVFDAERVMNTSLYSLGYRYESMDTGNFEGKIITGRLIEGAPQDVVGYYNASGQTDRPMGFYGTDLGYELDMTYSYHYQREVDLGLGLAAAMPGKAWRTSSLSTPSMGFGLMANFAIKF